MAKAHRPDVLGEWAKENGFNAIYKAYHPTEVNKRRTEAVKAYNQRKQREQERRNERQR